jgi:hypothetical protein
MSQQHDKTTPAGAASARGATRDPDQARVARRFFMTDMPTRLLLLLVALGVPRTVLADLNIVPPESGLLYYFLALTPFGVWLAVALGRRSRRPFADFLMVGVLYGLSLLIIHQVLWGVGPSLGHNPPASAVEFADQFSAGWRDFALRGYTSGIAMIIGIGSGLVAGIVAVGSHVWRSKRSR